MLETDSSIILAAPAEFTPDHPSIIATPNAVGGVGGNDDVGSSPNVGGGVNLAVTHPVDPGRGRPPLIPVTNPYLKMTDDQMARHLRARAIALTVINTGDKQGRGKGRGRGRGHEGVPDEGRGRDSVRGGGCISG